MSDARTARAAAADVLANCHELLKDNPTAHMVMGIVQAQAMAALTLATLAGQEPRPAVQVGPPIGAAGFDSLRCCAAHPTRNGVWCTLPDSHNKRNTAHAVEWVEAWH